MSPCKLIPLGCVELGLARGASRETEISRRHLRTHELRAKSFRAVRRKIVDEEFHDSLLCRQ
jgi:hypothetical protein